jgi:hypothetical protein
MDNNKVREALGAFVDETKGKYDDWLLWRIKSISEKASEALSSDPWRPISTAPKEKGTGIQYLYGAWINGEWYQTICYCLSNPEIYKFTHWQPLPNPPEKK